MVQVFLFQFLKRQGTSDGEHGLFHWPKEGRGGEGGFLKYWEGADLLQLQNQGKPRLALVSFSILLNITIEFGKIVFLSR